MEDNRGCFVKISNHVSDIQQGKLYCQPLKHFIDLENSTGLRGQGDKLEAQIPIFRKEYHHTNYIETISCTKTYNFENYPVFCLCFLPVNECGMCQFTPAQTEEFSKFGKHSIVILDVDEFIRRFDKACKLRGYEYAHSKVHYEGFWKPSPEIEQSLKENPIISCFRKDIFFSLQNEYRFVICKEVKNPFIFEIGDISDISRICENCFTL